MRKLICASTLLFTLSLHAQTPAFPGALGFGANATGGRGGTVVHVTTLADSGQGSFRDAVSHSHRIVVFDVGGYIKLNSAVSCAGDLTIAGQTAPGGGIGFRGGEISFANRSNIICRYIRIRPGSETSSHTDDALSLYLARDIICDHCSFEFGPWNNIDAVSDDWQNHPVTDVTFQNCLNADPSKNVAGDSKPGQQFGAHTESVSSRMSWFYCAFANSHNRNPLAKINNVFINNVDYNCSAGYTTHTSTSFSHDIVNNYFIAGPAYSSSADFPWYQVDNNQSIYYTGNLFDANEDGALNGATTTPYWYQGGTGTILTSPWASVTANVPIYSAADAYRLVISRVGALPRDQIDNLVISQMKTLGKGTTGTGAGTVGPNGSLYSDQTQTGLGNNGYGVINGGVAPIDSDGDGMPDYWEKAVGLNYLSASDAMTIAADGYANIEHYLNWLADPHVLTVTNTPVDVDLWQYTSGFTNASPIYSVRNASNGVVTLNSGHIAHFEPNPDFSGLGSFQFSVRTADAAYSNTVNVLVTPQTPPANLLWQGDGTTNLWANESGLNWLKGTNLVAFASGDNVTFDDTGSNTPAVQLSGLIAAGTVYVLADQDYAFGGHGYLAGPTVLFKTGNGTLTLNTTNNFTGGTTINDGAVQVGDGFSFNGGLAGNVTNNGALIYATPGTMTSSVNISGSGTLTKKGAGALTLSGTQTYTNLTTVNTGSLTFSGMLPQGDVVDNGSLVFAPSEFALYDHDISGSGSLTAAGSDAIILSGANGFAGDLTSQSGFLILSNNAAAGAGTVVYDGGAVVVAAGTVITNNFSISGSFARDLCMMATNTGTATWAGNILVGGSAQWRPGSDGGTLVFSGNAIQGNHYFIIPRGSVQIASNAFVSCTQPGAAFGRDLGGNNRSANITIRDHASVSLASASLGGGKSGGSVTLTVRDQAALSLGANLLDLHNVTRSTALTTLRLNGGVTTVGGFTKTRTSYGNAIEFNGGTLRAGADNSSFLPAFTVSTNLVQSGGAIIDNGGFAITIGAPLIHDPALGTTADGGLAKFGAGTLTISSEETYTGPTFVNSGTLALSGRGLMPASSRIEVAAGATLQTDGAMNVLNGQTLSGDGSLAGNIVCGLGAVLSPGRNGIGSLTFSNSLTLSHDTNRFEISHSSLTNDSVKVFGTLICGGALIVTNLGVTALAAGDSFKLFDATSYSGAFRGVTLPSLPFGLAWNANALNSSGVISVVLATVPVIGSVSISGNGLTFRGTGGVGSANLVLLGATNLATPLSNWTRLLTNQFDPGGNFNLTNPFATNLQSFYRLQMQ